MCAGAQIRSSKSFGGRGGPGMVSSEHLVALQALLWCLNVQRLGLKSWCLHVTRTNSSAFQIGLSLRAQTRSSKSFGGRGALGMVSLEQPVALQALLWCLNVTEAWTQVMVPTRVRGRTSRRFAEGRGELWQRMCSGRSWAVVTRESCASVESLFGACVFCVKISPRCRVVMMWCTSICLTLRWWFGVLLICSTGVTLWQLPCDIVFRSWSRISRVDWRRCVRFEGFWSDDK